MLELGRKGAVAFDYGNNLRGQALDAGVDDAFEIPGFVPAYIRPLFCEGKGPFRWAALSGEAADIAAIDRAIAISSPTTSRSSAGSAWPASAWRSRDCPRASAGWGTATGGSSASE